MLLVRSQPGVRVVRLPAEIEAPVEITGSHVEVRGAVLRASNRFRGRALIVCRGCSDVRFSGFTLDGNRQELEVPAGLPPSDVPFARFTPDNGILLENARRVRIEGVRFANVAGFAVLASASSDLRISGSVVSSSGSRDARGRNNTTGGFLFEEGTSAFRVEECRFEDVSGNAVWTHSLYTSPRNGAGLIRGNTFRRIGRDAIQVGHAENVRVEGNQGYEIGYPEALVGAEPVAIDTAGNVNGSTYAANRFERINGKCIDLDGFHDGEVSGNVCEGVNGYGIVMNNANPDMRAAGVTIASNEIRGARLGGIFVIGTRNTVVRNRLLDLKQGATGILLGAGAERPDPARGNRIEENEIAGDGVAGRCVISAPGAGGNAIAGNRCHDETTDPYPYAEAVPGYRYSFPRDHFEHPDFRTEWWYYTGNLRADDGHRYGFELVFFRQAQRRGPTPDRSAWRADDLYLAHMAFTDIDGDRFRYQERLNRAGPGVAGASFAERRVWNGNWSAVWKGEVQTIRAVGPDCRFTLRLTPTKPPVIHGENGVSQKGEGRGRASCYLSFPRLEASGELNSRPVRGTAWMDHEWFTNQLGRGQEGWDWFSVQLENNTELMLFELRRAGGGIDPHSSGTYIDPQGRARHLSAADFTLTPLEYWNVYPVRWRIAVPSLGIALECRASVRNQELTGTQSYWEGAVTYSGSSNGVGYLEMTGYREPVRM